MLQFTTSFNFKISFSLILFSFICLPISYSQNTVMCFDGSNDYLDMGNYAGNGVRTMELWFKPDTVINSSLPNHKYLIVREIGGINNNEFNIVFLKTGSTNAGAIQFTVRDASNVASKVLSNSKSWNANQWYHLAAVIHPVNGTMLFIDGVKQTSTNVSTAPTTSVLSSTTVGGTPAISDRYFKGCLEDVRFSSKAEYTVDFSPSCPDLAVTDSTLGLWNFNGTSDSTAIDSSGNSYHADIYGTTRDSLNACDTSIATLDSVNSKVMCFDGINDYLDMGQNVGNGVRTMELWFKPDTVINSSLPNHKYLIVREIGSPNNNEFNIVFLKTGSINSGALQFTVRNASNVASKVLSNSKSWNANQWYHLAAVIHPVNGTMLFIDGVKQTSTNVSTAPTTSVLSSTTVGGTPAISDRYFKGCLEDVRFSSKAEYTVDFSPSCPDLAVTDSTLGLWNFNGTSDSIAIDSSGNSYHADIYGTTRDSSIIICSSSPSLRKKYNVDKTENEGFMSINEGYSFSKLYPNPAKDQSAIYLSETVDRILIISIDGRTVVEFVNVQENRFDLDLTQYESGLYIISVEKAGDRELHKLIIK